MADTLLLDRIGMGTTEEAPKKLLQIRDLTLDKCIDVIRNSKTTASRLKMMSEARYEEIKGKKSCKQDKRNPDCTDESQHNKVKEQKKNFGEFIIVFGEESTFFLIKR
ncbi:hypothetical protein LSH36_117g05112 [Paralvinella palmiformis]|uniref:Uncharacterized protein n=1 Tax=Paralvinella palmiformis TaxID=53620 RepID=A0AAD9NAF5_9ANNE|nr:hypothetical protein LSH36_117g05112 [Paralvinella palmiformis]